MNLRCAYKSIPWYTNFVDPYSLYVHIPFCQQRCSYCDFNTYEHLNSFIPPYCKALCREIEYIAARIEYKLSIHTIYFGGGTPSLIPWNLLEPILETIANCFDLLPGMELTLESNPGTVSPEYLKAIKRLGVNRLSLGMQSANPEELQILERTHTYRDVINSFIWARQAGLDDVNLDLIFGLPNQTIDSWTRSLELAINLKPSHFSLYALTLEEGTAMNSWVNKGRISQPDPDLAADMYEWASSRLDEAGYLQYEISNWALSRKPDDGFKCKHNLQYWRNLPYIGVGAGAHGFWKGFRTANVLSPVAYIQRFTRDDKRDLPNTPAVEYLLPMDINTEMGETMLMGLRLVREGVSIDGFSNRFGQNIVDVFSDQVTHFISEGLLEWADEDGERLRLTSRGRLLGNQVFMSFV
jgi:oxygen-independent coproporphyrinogen III oxidase